MSFDLKEKIGPKNKFSRRIKFEIMQWIPSIYYHFCNNIILSLNQF